VTVAGNSAGKGGSASFGGGLLMTGLTTVRDSILAANIPNNCEGGPASGGHNLDDGGSCGWKAAGDKAGVNPMLGSLAANGGPTQTLLPAPGSPVIDAGEAAGCPATDQRGIARPQGPACDIGAVELAPPRPVTGAAAAVGLTSATLTGSSANAGLAAGNVFFQYGTSTAYGSQTASQPLAASLATPMPFSALVSGLQPATTYHFRAVAVSPEGTSVGADQTFTTALPPPALSGVAQSHSRWREGGRLAAIARRHRPPIGTTFSFTLNEAATVTFAFTQKASGRKVRGRCVSPARGNRHRPACKRTVTKAALSFAAHAGTDTVSFQGRLSAARHLQPGTYTVLIAATNPAGQSQARSLTFTIVPH
jgi:hypothetical protein